MCLLSDCLPVFPELQKLKRDVAQMCSSVRVCWLTVPVCSEQKLKGDVAQMIRKNQMLERDLDSLDVKIGLLVKNRITLQVRPAPFHCQVLCGRRCLTYSDDAPLAVRTGS